MNFSSTIVSRMQRRLLLSLALLLIIGGCSRTGSPLQTLAGETFDVYRDGDTYHADAPSASFSGSLKEVVESAVSQLVAAGSGTVSFRAGDFDLGAEWFEFYDITGITFEGQGMDATVLRNDSSASTDTEPFDCTRCDNITIRDMSVSAGGPDRSTSDALDFDGSDGVTIERVKVTDSRARGIVFDGKGSPSDGLGTADNNTIRDCVISGNAIPSDGIQLLASSHNLVEGCTITDVGGRGIYMNKSSSSSDQPNKPSDDNVVRNNHVENVGRSGIRVNSGSRNEITNNTVLNSSDDVRGLDGIRLISFSSVPCDDNQVIDNVATDNQTTKTQKYGLKIFNADCRRTVVEGNDFAGNWGGEIFDGGTDTIYNASDPKPPSTPVNLSASAEVDRVALSWDASSDNVGVTSYEVWRDGDALALLGDVTTYEDTDVQPGTTYEYRVRATDAVGNWSALSSAVSATTDSANALTFSATDDTYIREDRPSDTYGSATVLRVDGSPTQDTLVKFQVADVGGPIIRATLRLYNVNSSGLGGHFHEVSSSWNEGSVTWNNAPAAGTQVGSLGSVTPGNWYEVDVSSAVNGEGQVSFRISSTDANGAYYSAKEGDNAPQLVILTTGDGSGNVPPSADAQTYTPTHDSYVREDRATTNYGAATSLRADGGPVQDMLMTFDVTGVGGAQVSSATLRLYNVNSASLGGSFYTASSGWDEGSVTWDSAPATGTSLGSLGTVKPGNWYDIDVSLAVSGDGQVSFRVSSSSANGAYYSSKEGSNAPELVVTTQ